MDMAEALITVTENAVAPAVPTQPPLIPDGLPTFPLKDHVVMTSESLRKDPYFVRGRDHETVHIAGRLQELPSAIQLILGPPGAGKTSMLSNVEQFARARGCKVIWLTLNDFNGDEALCAALRGHGSDNSATAEIAGGAKSRSSTTTFDAKVIQHSRSQAETEHHAVVQGTSWYRTILATADEHPEFGVLYTWDEVQNIRGDGETVTDDARARIHNFLISMHTHMLKESTPRGRRPRTMLVAAGLLNARAELERFMISRFDRKDVMRIGPLGDSAARQIIHDHMTAATPTGAALPAPSEQQVTEIVQACGGNTQHLASAAFALQQAGRRALAKGEATISDDEMTTVRREIQANKGNLYVSRVGELPEDPRHIAATALAQATEWWGPRLPVKVTGQLLTAIAQSLGMQGLELTNEMIRKGVIELRNDTDFFPGRNEADAGESHYCFAIHSMADWLNEQRRTAKGKSTATADNDALISKHMGRPKQGEQIAEWDWNKPPPDVIGVIESPRNISADAIRTQPMTSGEAGMLGPARAPITHQTMGDKLRSVLGRLLRGAGDAVDRTRNSSAAGPDEGKNSK